MAVYQSPILVDREAHISTAQVAAELRRFYSDDRAPAEITVVDDVVALCWPDFSLTLGFSSEPHVAAESAELAEEFAAVHSARERIARCSTRSETSADEDPNMDHFNDYLFVGEAVARLGKVYRFDQRSGEFLE